MISVPDSPIANPTSECIIAGASFIPSPVTATTSPISFNALTTRNFIIGVLLAITEILGKIFFKDLFSSLKLNIREYTFNGHDEVVAYSLSIPFASTLVFGSIMKHQDAPGTTFKKHMAIARGLLSEDDYLLTEILFNPNTPGQLDKIISALSDLSEIVNKKDTSAMKTFLDSVRKNLE